MYSFEEVLDYVYQEDVKFIRLAFLDIFGKQKNISIMQDELARAFRDGISFDASSITGFGDEVHSDLFLHPDPATLSVLPWRPSHGRVVRMYCDIRHPDGSPFTADSRYILKQAIAAAKKQKIAINFGTEVEFYLFYTDEHGNPTEIPFDNAGYLDIAPEDKGENVRHEICLTLMDMGIRPESSHHEAGPGQNEVAFQYSDALTAADNTATLKWVVKSIAMQNGLYADFSPKPFAAQPGNGMHINISLPQQQDTVLATHFMAGVLAHIAEMTLFLNPTEQSYRRFGEKKAPKYITWSPENRSQLIRIPAVKTGCPRIELRSPDPQANPYLALALLIHAGLDGIARQLRPQPSRDINLYKADPAITDQLDTLPLSFKAAQEAARNSTWLKSILSSQCLDAYTQPLL